MSRPGIWSNLGAPAAVLAVAVLLAAFGGEKGRLVFLLCLGGVIAYLGDVLGSRFGKRRLSIFGMRPKYTALFFNVATGLAITMATLSGVAFISEPFRAMLFEVEELQQVVAQRRAERDALSVEAAQLTSKVMALEKTVHEQERRNEELNRTLTAKEDAFMVFPRGKPLLPNPFLFPIDIAEDQLEQVVLRMVDEIRELAKRRGVVLPSDREISNIGAVIPAIYRDLQSLRRHYDARRTTGAIEFAPTQAFIEARSDKNVAIGEELHNVNFAVGANLRIFAAGDELASISIDGTQERNNILEQLFLFEQRVMLDMQRRGVSAFSIEVRNRQFTGMRMLELVSLVDRIEMRRKRVIVEVHAEDEVFVFGDLDLEYYIAEEPVPGGPEDVTGG